MKEINITLSNGRVVRVYPVPPYISDLQLSKFVPPVVPRVPVNPEVAIPGTDETIPNTEDPEYKAALRKFEDDKVDAYTDIRLLYGLKDEIPPSEWPTADHEEIWKFLGLDVKVPKDRIGRKLAYIKYELLTSGADLELVLRAIDQYGKPSPQAVEDLVNSFRGTDSGNKTEELPVQAR